MDLETLAKEAASYFETARRDPDDEDTTYTRCTDDAPEWVSQLVYNAHGGDFLPDDWRYTCIRAAVDFLADGGDADDGSEFADSHVDVYTGARLQWLASNLRRPGYVDEAVDDMGAQDLDTAESIGLGQYAEASEVFGLVVQSLTERLEEVDDDDDEPAEPARCTCGKLLDAAGEHEGGYGSFCG